MNKLKVFYDLAQIPAIHKWFKQSQSSKREAHTRPSLSIDRPHLHTFGLSISEPCSESHLPSCFTARPHTVGLWTLRIDRRIRWGEIYDYWAWSTWGAQVSFGDYCNGKGSVLTSHTVGTQRRAGDREREKQRVLDNSVSHICQMAPAKNRQLPVFRYSLFCPHENHIVSLGCSGDNCYIGLVRLAQPLSETLYHGLSQ